MSLEFLTAEGWTARERPRTSRAGRALLIGFFVLLAAAAVIQLGLPQLLRTLPVTSAIRIESMQGQVSGAYVRSGANLFKLYPYPAPPPAFPAGAAVTGSSPDISIKSRTLDELRMYTLRTGGREVAVRRQAIDAHTLRLSPLAPLPAGDYVVRASADSADPGWSYYYFRVKASP